MHGRSRKRPNKKVDIRPYLIQFLISTLSAVTAEVILKLLGI